MDRKIRSATYGPVSDEDGKSAAKLFSAAGAFFRRKKNADHRVVRRKQSAIVLRDVPKSEEELEAEELERLEELEAWHRIVREVAVLHRAREREEEIVEEYEAEVMIAEAEALMREINEAYGWQPGEPQVADRMFGTNVRAIIAQAKSARRVDFKTKNLINTMRRVSRSASVSKNEIASVAAVRNLVGGVTVNEAQLIADAKRLKWKELVEYTRHADQLARAEERAMAKKLGRQAAARDQASISLGRQLQR